MNKIYMLCMVLALVFTVNLSFAQIGPSQGVSSSANTIPGITNFDPSILPVSRAAMEKVRANTGRLRIGWIGDSTMNGEGAGTGGSNNTTAAIQASIPTDVAKQLVSSGITTTYDSVFGDGTLGNLGNSQLTYGAGWAVASPPSLGGQMLSNATTTATALAFTPASQITTCDVYYVDVAATDTFTIDLSGAGTITTTTGGTLAILKKTISAASGSYTLNVKLTAVGTRFWINGIDCYNTTTRQISMWNFGIVGATTGNFTTTGSAWSSLTALGLYAPDLTVIDLGINDETASESYATFYSTMQTIITQAKISGDVILVMHHDVNGHTAAQEAVTLSALQALSVANNIPLVSFYQRMGTWAVSNANGEQFDALHCNAVGYNDESRMISWILQQL